MKFIPILFSTPMVQSTLNGRKKQTRRTKGLELINDRPNEFIRLDGYHQDGIPRPARKYDDRFYYAFTGKRSNMVTTVVHCPYGKPGDILWVRENYCPTGSNEYLHNETNKPFFYAADIIEKDFAYSVMKDYGWKMKTSIHMPKAACRLFLKVKSVRVERLNDITHYDSVAEGIEELDPKSYDFDRIGWRFKDYKGNSLCKPKASFETLWQSINGEQSWKDNPWVWVIEFERINLNPSEINLFLNNTINQK